MTKLTSDLGRILNDLKTEFIEFSRDTFSWFQQAQDAERLIVICLFILLFLALIAHKDSDGKRRSGGLFRQFAGAVMFVCVFAFATGWVLEARHEYGFLSWLA